VASSTRNIALIEGLDGMGPSRIAEANARLVTAAPAQAIILELVQLGLMTLEVGEAEFDGVMYWFDPRQADWCVGVVNAIGWDVARSAIAGDKPTGDADEAGMLPAADGQPPRFEFTHEPEESPDRAYVLVDGKFDVKIIHTGDGVAVDVYPRHGIDAIASTYAFDAEAEESEEA
jgi:hypothetical protein